MRIRWELQRLKEIRPRRRDELTPSAKVAPAKSGPKLTTVSMKCCQDKANPAEDGSILQSAESETEKADDAGDISKHVYC